MDVAADETTPGIIPAYAGSTSPFSGPLFDCRDHPRIRGEHDSADMSDVIMQGSSPHTRGAHPYLFLFFGDVGIIPAYAGSTSSEGVKAQSYEDHPRIRGEHGVDHAQQALKSGSSPHTRGALAASVLQTVSGGIIPAYAGSTQARTRGPRLRRDHPRIRGEHKAL